MSVPSLSSHDCDVLRLAYTDVTENGVHLSTAIESVFRELTPEASHAELLRTTLYQAVRYGNISHALSGKLNGVVDAEEMFCPGWMRKRIEASLGDKTQEFYKRSLEEAPLTIRLNSLKPEALSFKLEDSGFGLFRTAEFKSGWFEQQDYNSQKVSLSLDVHPGMRVVDACAGNGGKTLHIAALMDNKGKIVALDTDEYKLATLRKRAVRAGANIIETRHVDTTKVVKRIAETADRVLIDAPCSGTGVLRRNPDILWHITEEQLARLIELQSEILSRNALIAKPGGLVVYATCSVLREECEDRVNAFLADNSEFSLQSEWRTLPGDDGGDGFYVAVLKRSERAQLN